VRFKEQHEEVTIDCDEIPQFLWASPIISRSQNPGDSVALTGLILVSSIREERVGKLHEAARFTLTSKQGQLCSRRFSSVKNNLQGTMSLLNHNLSASIFKLLPQFLQSQRLFQPTQLSQFLYTPFLPSAVLSIPSISLHIPGLLGDIWEGILKAVPKKKTSHMKKRHRQLAGKALKDVNSINTCPACGKPKRAHLLCPYCVEG
jgi:large subunit ribosomal protein L32